MGAPAVSDPEALPLLKPLPEPVKETREWKGHWAAVGGDCSAPDVAACCLAVHAPWIAFGWNSARGLGLDWRKEALKMFLLTTVVFALLRCGMCALTHMRCMPHDDPMDPHAVGPHLMGLPTVTPGNPGDAVLPTKLRGNAVNPNAVAASTVTSTTASTAAATSTVDAATSSDEDDAAKEDVPHTHHHKHDEDHKHKHEEHDEAPHDKPDGKHRHHEEEEKVEDDEDDDHHPHFFWHPRHDDDMMMRGDMDEDEFEECMAPKVAPWALLMLAVAISSAGYFVYLAALRRRMIREKFGIAGDFRHDVLLWAGCSPCALAQETRTLMTNRVEEGVWHGPAPTFAQAPTAPIMAA